MIVYQNYTTESGAERVKAFSDRNLYIERDGVEPVEAELIDPDLTVSDTLEMLSEMGVDTDDK